MSPSAKQIIKLDTRNSALPSKIQNVTSYISHSLREAYKYKNISIKSIINE